MQQPVSDANEQVIRRIDRLEDRLEERTRNLVTRSDLESLRRELVARDSLQPVVDSITAQIIRVDKDRITDREALEKRIDKLEQEQLTRQDRLWMRLGQAMSVLAFILALFEFMTHLRLLP